MPPFNRKLLIQRCVSAFCNSEGKDLPDCQVIATEIIENNSIYGVPIPEIEKQLENQSHLVPKQKVEPYRY